MQKTAQDDKRKIASSAIDPTALSRMSFPDRLRYAIGLAGGVAQASEKIGVSPRTLAAYFAGETSPTISTLEAVAAVSGVALAWLSSGGDAENRIVPAPPLPPVRITLPGEALLQLVRALAVDLPQPVRDAIADALRTPPDTPAE